MTPLLHIATANKQLYNESHIHTRNCIERCFGVLKKRFPILAYGIRLQSIDAIMAVITSTCILHNIAILFNDQVKDIIDLEDPQYLNLVINSKI